MLIDNILYVTWKGITWINTLAGVSWPATSQAVVQCYKLYTVVFEPPRYCTFLMHKGGGGGVFHVRFNQLAVHFNNHNIMLIHALITIYIYSKINGEMIKQF